MQQRLDLAGDGGDAIRAYRVDLGDDGDAARDAEQVEDREMLARLRHDAVIGRHHKDDEVDAGGAGEHGAHQLLVARHVDETERAAIGVTLVGETEIDGDAALLFLGQPIGVDSRQRFDERGLAVVDMACGGDDHGVTSHR